MMTGWLINGSAVSGVIVCTPAPGMLNTIVSRSPLSPFESRIAWRSEPGPLSFVLIDRYLTAPGVTTVLVVTELFDGSLSALSELTVATVASVAPLLVVHDYVDRSAGARRQQPRLQTPTGRRRSTCRCSRTGPRAARRQNLDVGRVRRGVVPRFVMLAE